MDSETVTLVDSRKGHYVKDSYDRLWHDKLSSADWLRNDGKGRIEYAADYLRNKPLSIGSRLLDIGCGRGTLRLFLEKDWEFFGIDISPKAIEEAQKRYQHARCADLNWQKIPCSDRFFDIVVLLDVIEHVFDPVFLLREIHRALKAGAELVLTTPNILCERLLNKFVSERRFPKTSGDKVPYDGGHIHFFTYRDCFDLLTNAGFRSIKAIGQMKGAGNFELKEASVWISAVK